MSYFRRAAFRRAEGWHFCFHSCFSVWVFIAMDADGPRSFFEYLVSLVYILGISLPIDLPCFSNVLVVQALNFDFGF